MLTLRAARWILRGSLAALPAPLIARLDAWSQRLAQRQAQRRRERLAAAHR